MRTVRASTQNFDDVVNRSLAGAGDRPEGRSLFQYDSLEDAFPNVDPEFIPYGNRVLVQLRVAKTKTKGGIALTSDQIETEKWNTQIGKVVAVGPTAFKNQDTLEPWPEGAWCKEGDFVRIPKHGGDRWEIDVPGKSDKVMFVLIKDSNLNGRHTGDPLAVVAFI